MKKNTIEKSFEVFWFVMTMLFAILLGGACTLAGLNSLAPLVGFMIGFFSRKLFEEFKE